MWTNYKIEKDCHLNFFLTEDEGNFWYAPISLSGARCAAVEKVDDDEGQSGW